EPRAIWSTAQVIIGLVTFLLAGVVVSGKLKANHQSLGFSDVLFPDRLWGLAIKNLPATRWPVCSGAWGLVFALCGVAWVGGLTYWLPSKQPPQAAKSALAKELRDAAARKDDDGEETREKAGEDPTGAEKPEKKDSETEETPTQSKKVTSKCVIVGYTVKDGELTGLVVATARGDELRYAGVVPASKDPAVRKDL